MDKVNVGLLIEGYDQPMWVFEMLKKIVEDGHSEIKLVIIRNQHTDSKKPEKESFFKRIIKNRYRLAFLLYTRMENILFKPKPDAFEIIDTTEFLKRIKKIEVEPVSTKFSDKFSANDISKIRAENLDVIIRLGFNILRGDILNVSKCGIWSFHHGDNMVNRGGPPGLWEVFKQWKETGVVLQVLTEDLDGGLVIDRSFSSTDCISVNRNKNNYYWKALSMIPRNLRKLQAIGPEKFMEKVKGDMQVPQFYFNRLFLTPSNFEVIKGLFKVYYKKLTLIIRKIFVFQQWILLYRIEKKSAAPSTSFFRYKKLLPPKDRFWADPFIIYKNNLYYVFIEELMYSSNKGHISVFTISPDGELSTPQKIIEESYHLSYPFVFQDKEDYYMIPESMENKSIDLYKCSVFPDKWEKVKVMMNNINAVDPTLFYYNNKYWLFVNVSENEGASEWDELFLYYADDFMSDNWTSHPQNPIVSDVKKARPAGRIFKQNDQYYRPSQNCSGHYGRGMTINRITVLSEHEYKEEVVQFIFPRWDKKLISTHTLSFEKNLTVIDGLYLRNKRFG